ncbi:MAG TPA: lysophospholipid acyltransferase family protein [Anaerolineales bacterium]|jgi:1-acyl-sn-glycerol-3-phosphate acyltransferase|nr:lysophospholipid acyltransferase family protein [Anaerolineales bacterium]
MDSTTPTTIEIDPRDKKKFYFTDTPQRRALIRLAKSLFQLIMTMEVTGLEHFPRSGPVILAANHVTNFDVFPMQFALPRPIFFMGKTELFKNPLMDVILRNLSGFPVHRGEKDEWAMRHAAKVLAHEQTLGIFPEGKRSKGKGLSVAKTGAARLALEVNCPIVPMVVVGSDRFFKQFPHRAGVQIKILPPLMPNPGESPLALTDRLMFRLARALPESMRGVYAEVPRGFTT